MSPVPVPNKDLNDSTPLNNQNDVPLPAVNNNDNENLNYDNYILINGDMQNNNNNRTTASNTNDQANFVDDDEDEDDDDEDDDSENEIDADLDFQLLASSRAFNQQKTSDMRLNNTSYDRNNHILEMDVFERKNVLECEEIELDESKSQQIKSLMSNFKLPDTSVPQWAKLVPEDVWKKNLLDSLNAKKTDLFDARVSSTENSTN